MRLASCGRGDRGSEYLLLDFIADGRRWDLGLLPPAELGLAAVGEPKARLTRSRKSPVGGTCAADVADSCPRSWDLSHTIMRRCVGLFETKNG